MPAEEDLDTCPQALITAAGAADVGLPLAGVVELQGRHEDRPLTHRRHRFPEIDHARLTILPCEFPGGHRPRDRDYFPESGFPSISSLSQARAKAQRRPAVRAGRPRASAAAARDRPAKYLNFTRSAESLSSAASFSRASSSARRSNS